MRRPKSTYPEQASIVSRWSRPSCHKGKAVGGRGSNRPENSPSPAGVVGSACADKVFEATCEIHIGGGSQPPSGVIWNGQPRAVWKSEGLIVPVKPVAPVEGGSPGSGMLLNEKETGH
jgi:hypothetical protein